jgi:hypothetical protein
MKVISFLLLLLLVSCTHKKINIAPNEYQSLPAIDYEDVIPFQQFDCWKLICSEFTDPEYFILNIPPYLDSTIYSSNNQTIDDYKTDYHPGWGFQIGCLPGFCFRFIKTFKDNSINYWTTFDSLRIFLGTIDNISEAQFLAYGFGYYSYEESVFKPAKDGYILIMLRYVSFGMPVQIDRFILKIFKNGEIKILERDIYYKNDYAII